MKAANPYTWLGLGLLLTGAALALTAYLLLAVVWLTAFGLALVVLGLILLALARSVPHLSPAYSRLLFQSGRDSISDLLEELSVTSRAIYLPPGMTENKPRALIPLDGTANPVLPSRLPAGRLIVRYGSRPDDIGLLVSTPGTGALEMTGQSGELGPGDLESSLNALFHGLLDVADRVAVTRSIDKLLVKLAGPHFEQDRSWGSQSLGSPVAAMAATLAAAALGQPVTVQAEQGNARTYSIEIRLLPCASTTAIF